MSKTKELIESIQKERGSKVIVYFTGDRPPINASIAEDAVRPLYEHLLSIGEHDKIDLFLYSRGGDVSVPWRIVSMFREHCKEFSVLIPYKAHSAATLLSLGTDAILMNKKAELGPIDPTLVKRGSSGTAGPLMEVSVEDVNSYLSFVKEKANINDQSALMEMISTLAKQIEPLTLGKVNRQNSHIRLVARKLLTGRNTKVEESKITSIIETLTEKMYSHGHGIARTEAKGIGLPVEFPEKKLEQLMWELFCEYEKALEINSSIDAEYELLNSEEKKFENLPIAIIESEKLRHSFNLHLYLKKRRQIPPNPQISINLNLSMPPGVDVNALPQQIHQLLQKMTNELTQQIQNLVSKQIVEQSPIIGFDIRAFGGKWIEKR